MYVKMRDDGSGCLKMDVGECKIVIHFYDLCGGDDKFKKPEIFVFQGHEDVTKQVFNNYKNVVVATPTKIEKAIEWCKNKNISKDKIINDLLGALAGLVGDTGLHENDCECDNTHKQNNTVCQYCYAKEILSKYSNRYTQKYE